MGEVVKLRNEVTTVDSAVAAYLRRMERETRSEHTRRAYRLALTAFGDAFTGQDMMGLDPEKVADWFTGRWGDGSPATWKARRWALGAAAAWWSGQEMPWPDPFRMIGPKRQNRRADRALSRNAVRALLASRDVPLRERLLWTMLYETAARSSEVLALNVEDLDRGNKQAPVIRKGGASDTIIWETGTAILLPRYLKGRVTGPLFLTGRKARGDLVLHSADLDSSGCARLSYRQAEDAFRKWSGGKTLHQLRHSALSHRGEAGWSQQALMKLSGHQDSRTLDQYVRISVESLARMQADYDPARRR